MTRCGSCAGGAGGSGSGASGICTCFAEDSCGTTLFLRLDGISGTYTSTPDSVGVSVTSSIDLRAKIAPDSWSGGPLVGQTLISKGNGGIPETSYHFYISTTGALVLSLSANGTSNSASTSTAVTGFAPGSIHWVRATWNNTTDVVQFFTSESGATWTQLGLNGAISLAGIFDSTVPVDIGGRTGVDPGAFDMFTGNIYYIEIRNGIDGAVVASPDFTQTPWEAGDAAPTSNPDSNGNIWTLHGNAIINEGPSGSCVNVVGNGTTSHPFQFHPSQIPDPRPFGFIQQTTQQSNVGVDYLVPFDLNETGIEGGMTNLTLQPTRLTAPYDGVYLVGAFVCAGVDAQDSFSASIRKNDDAVTPEIDLTLEVPDNAVNRPYSIMTLISMVAGDYINLHVTGSATMDLIVTNEGIITRPTLWAQWVGEL